MKMKNSVFSIAVLAIAVLAGTLSCQVNEQRAEPQVHTEPLTLLALPHGVHGHRAHRVGDRLVVLGGFGLDAIVFDAQSRKWSKFPSMNIHKEFFSSVVINEQIYTIGGAGRSNGPGVIECFDSSVNKWKVVLSSKKLPQSHLSATAVGDQIFIIGGFPQAESGAHVFDVRTGVIATMPPIPNAKPDDHFHYVATLDNKLHVLGGMRFADEGSGPMNQHWMWDGKTWNARADLPKPSLSKFGAYGVLGGKLYIFNKIHDLHHAYDVSTDRWSDSPSPLPTSLIMPAVVAENNVFHVLGGIKTMDGAATKEVLRYDAAKNSWRTAGNR